MLRDFRHAPQHVRDFYKDHNEKMTMDFTLMKSAEYLAFDHGAELLSDVFHRADTFFDESDPDLGSSDTERMSQKAHAITSALAAMHYDMPQWFILTVLIHDLAKVKLAEFGEEQWAIVGDTWIAGCPWPKEIVFHEFFASNPDAHHKQYNRRNGIYASWSPRSFIELFPIWGHDEYLYQVILHYQNEYPSGHMLPDEALWMIRYHSMYCMHEGNAYRQFMNQQDKEMLRWVQIFNRFDLYPKTNTYDASFTMQPYFTSLIDHYFPHRMAW